MESFAVTYASCQEVRSGEEAVEALLETHWPHMFAIGGEVVLGVCMDIRTVTLTTAWVRPDVPRAPTIQRLLNQVQAACDSRQMPMQIGFSL
jgi:hypothetical protein